MTTSYYTHWRDVPESAWRWKNFSPAEIACRGSRSLRINEEALDKLQALRDRLAKPLIVRSAYRSPAHTQAIGGAPRSRHLDGAAFDIAMTNHDPVAFEEAARAVGFKGLGLYPESIRVDQGSEFVSRDLDLWAYRRGVTLDFSRPGKPTDNAFIEAFNGHLRAECLNTHWFLSLADAREKLEAWRRDYNEVRPHGAIGNKPPILLMNHPGENSPPE